ncbi:MAG: hypothetical protein N2645_21650 [Clostridia bacterium]|nr:hypothetical protein [Clostridia bacterium]
MPISFLMLIFLSLPEAILNLVLILLVLGKKEEYLNRKLESAIRFSFTVILMLIATSTLRPLASNVIESMIYHIIAYIIIISLVYGKSLKSIYINIGTVSFGTTIIMLFISTIDNLYMPILTILHSDINSYLNNILVLIPLSIPVRLVQGGAICLLWKYSKVLEVTKINKMLRKIFVISNVIIITAEYYLSNNFVNYYKMYTTSEQIFYTIAILMLTITVNFLVFSCIYITIKKVIMISDHNYKKLQQCKNDLEEDAKYAFNEVYRLLKDSENVDQAIDLLEKILNKSDIKPTA